MDDYKKLVLSRTTGVRQKPGRTAGKVIERPAPAAASGKTASLKKQIAAEEETMSKLAALIAKVDGVLGDGSVFMREPERATTLARQRQDLEQALVLAEEKWLALTLAQDGAA